MKQSTANVIICPNTTDLPLENNAIHNNTKLNEELKRLRRKSKRKIKRCQQRLKKKGKIATNKCLRKRKKKRKTTGKKD